MEGIEIVRHWARHEDERGYVFCLIHASPLKETLIMTRKKGSIFGNHYHTGKDPTRNPEIQYLLKGKLRLTAKDMKSGKTESFIVEENAEIRIAHMIAHKFEALEDCIVLEFHNEISDYKDMIKVEL